MNVSKGFEKLGISKETLVKVRKFESLYEDTSEKLVKDVIKDVEFYEKEGCIVDISFDDIEGCGAVMNIMIEDILGFNIYIN